MEILRKEVVVVGLGAFGSAAVWRLAARGVEVAGIERQAIGHPFGSSHGTTRLFRIACMEHPGLTAIARKSLELWTELGGRAGQTLVQQVGSLNVGAPTSRPVRGARAAAEQAGAPVEELSHDDLVARYPQYGGLGPDEVAVLDPGAGICFSEPIIKAQVADAARLGADIYPHTMVTAIEPGPDEVVLRTPTVEFRASRVVVCAGAWLGKLVPGLPVVPRRIPLFWFQPRDPALFRLDRFPSFIWERPDGTGLWGHGAGDGFAVKVGLEDDDFATGFDPDELNRYIHPRQDIAHLSDIITGAFPGLDPNPEKVIPCMVTDSPDGQFLLGRPPGTTRVVIAGGDSGHGFKHSGGIGELLAQLALDEKPYADTTFVDPARFA